MGDPRRATGRSAENICAHRLTRRGWQILARNWKIRAGEIDLIARAGFTLVFVEVKSGHVGSLRGPPAPALAVGPHKQRRLRRIAETWLAGSGRSLAFRDTRFDVVGVVFGRDGEIVAYDHIEDAF